MCVQGRMPSARSLSVTHQSSLRHGAHHGIHFIERKPGLCPCWATLSQDPSQEGERCSRASSLGVPGGGGSVHVGLQDQGVQGVHWETRGRQAGEGGGQEAPLGCVSSVVPRTQQAPGADVALCERDMVIFPAALRLWLPERGRGLSLPQGPWVLGA